MGGDDNLESSIGHGWAKGPRNAPTALNAVFNTGPGEQPRVALPILPVNSEKTPLPR